MRGDTMYLYKFARRLQYLMELDGISQRALALKINVDRKCVRLWMQGVNFPKYGALIRLSLCLNVRIDYLLGLEDVMGDGAEIPLSAANEETVRRRFYRCLIEYMETNSLTKYALAKKVKIDQKALANWLKKGSMPETHTLIKLAALMNISVQDLLIEPN